MGGGEASTTNTIAVFHKRKRERKGGEGSVTWPDWLNIPLSEEGKRGKREWKGGFRAPSMISLSGGGREGREGRKIISGLDWFSRFLSSSFKPEKRVGEREKGKESTATRPTNVIWTFYNRRCT